MNSPDLLALRHALEANWQTDTSYRGIAEDGNPARGQCYVTSLVVSHFFPSLSVVKGTVASHNQAEGHFWNVLAREEGNIHIDLTWQQFPTGAYVKNWRVIDRDDYFDNDAEIRYKTLLERVDQHLDSQQLG